MLRGKAFLPGRGGGLKGLDIEGPAGSIVGANPVTICLRITMDDVEGVPEIEQNTLNSKVYDFLDHEEVEP